MKALWRLLMTGLKEKENEPTIDYYEAAKIAYTDRAVYAKTFR